MNWPSGPPKALGPEALAREAGGRYVTSLVRKATKAATSCSLAASLILSSSSVVGTWGHHTAACSMQGVTSILSFSRFDCNGP